jgi:hypothetical protein
MDYTSMMGETEFESRLFSGFASSSSPHEMFEPPFCSELMARRIEHQHEQRMHSSLKLLKEKMKMKMNKENKEKKE